MGGGGGRGGAGAHLDGVGAHAGVRVLEAGAGAGDHAGLEVRRKRVEVLVVEALDADVVRLGGLDLGDLCELRGVVRPDAERRLDAVDRRKPRVSLRRRGLEENLGRQYDRGGRGVLGEKIKINMFDVGSKTGGQTVRVFALGFTLRVKDWKSLELH